MGTVVPLVLRRSRSVSGPGGGGHGASATPATVVGFTIRAGALLHERATSLSSERRVTLSRAQAIEQGGVRPGGVSVSTCEREKTQRKRQRGSPRRASRLAGRCVAAAGLLGLLVWSGEEPADAYSYIRGCTNVPAYYVGGIPYLNVWDSGLSGTPGTSGWYASRTSDALWDWNNFLTDVHPVMPATSTPPSPLNIWVADFYGDPTWIGWNYRTCAPDIDGRMRFGDNTVYIDRTDTDSFPWSNNGQNGFYGVIGTVKHELGHAVADLAHQSYSSCGVTNPIMVSSFSGPSISPPGGRWQFCGQWGLAADDVNGVNNAY